MPPLHLLFCLAGLDCGTARCDLRACVPANWPRRTRPQEPLTICRSPLPGRNARTLPLALRSSQDYSSGPCVLRQAQHARRVANPVLLEPSERAGAFSFALNLPTESWTKPANSSSCGRQHLRRVANPLRPTPFREFTFICSPWTCRRVYPC